ncbi:MAG: hemolysin III family protein [Sediminicola sp.]
MLDKEEKLNALSHAVGVLLGLVGTTVLFFANSHKTAYATVGLAIYGLSLILLFTASTFYHLSYDPKLKHRFRILDHISIFYLIAGTYTPVTLITLWEGNGLAIFSVVWGIALVGTFLKLFFTGKYEIVSLLLYLIMGWLIVFDLENLVGGTSFLGLSYLMLGGAFYTIGILFYALKYIPYNHFIWHLFVLAGAISHWMFIFTDVV